LIVLNYPKSCLGFLAEHCFSSIFLAKNIFLKKNDFAPNRIVWRCVYDCEKKFAKCLLFPIKKSYFDPLKIGGSP